MGNWCVDKPLLHPYAAMQLNLPEDLLYFDP